MSTVICELEAVLARRLPELRLEGVPSATAADVHAASLTDAGRRLVAARVGASAAALGYRVILPDVRRPFLWGCR